MTARTMGRSVAVAGYTRAGGNATNHVTGRREQHDNRDREDGRVVPQQAREQAREQASKCHTNAVAESKEHAAGGSSGARLHSREREAVCTDVLRDDDDDFDSSGSVASADSSD